MRESISAINGTDLLRLSSVVYDLLEKSYDVYSHNQTFWSFAHKIDLLVEKLGPDLKFTLVTPNITPKMKVSAFCSPIEGMSMMTLHQLVANELGLIFLRESKGRMRIVDEQYDHDAGRISFAIK